jgi:cell division protein FtsQ
VARVPSRRLRLLRSVAVVSVLTVLVAGGWVVYGTDVFAVSRVRVTGTHVLTSNEVRAVAGIRVGTPLARLDLETVTERLSRLAPVARVVVRRDWPDSVAIRVTERTPVAVTPGSGGFLVVDASGVVFDRVADRPVALPLMELARPGPGDATTRDALTVLAALTPQLRKVLVRLSAPSPTRITLRLTAGRSVVWGDAAHNDKKARVATVLLRRPVRVIDVSAPDVVTTR